MSAACIVTQAAAAPSPRNDASPSSPRSCPRTHGTTRRLKSFHSSPYRNSHPASARIALPQSRRPSGSKSAGVGTAFRNTNNRSSRATFPRADLADRPPVTRPRAADSVCCRWFINLIVLSLVKSSPLRPPYLATPSHRHAHCSRMAGAARNRSASSPSRHPQARSQPPSLSKSSSCAESRLRPRPPALRRV